MRPIEASKRGVSTAYQFTGLGHTISTLGGSPPTPLSHPHLDLLGRSSSHPLLHELNPMRVKANITAPVSAEKRQLCASYDDNVAQNRKKARFSPQPAQPDGSALPPPTTWLSTVMDVPDTSHASSCLEYQNSGPSIDEASNQHASWQANDVSIGITDDWSFGQTNPGSFGILLGQFGHEDDIKVDLDSNEGVDWAGHDISSAMDSTPTMVFTPAMELVFQSNEPKLPSVQPTLGSTATPDPVHNFPAHSGNATKANTAEQIQHHGLDAHSETCFGVVHTSVTTSFTRKQDTTPVPVRLTPSESLLKLYFKDSDKYAGIVTEPALNKILMEFDTKLDATLSPPVAQQAPPTTASRKKDKPEYRSNSHSSLRIIVYGTMKDCSEIGKLLSDVGLYLQHPSANECDMNAEYFNPHYLVRPGSCMPRLDELEISPSDATTASAGGLDETSKSRLMRIFDCADDDGITPKAEPSPRLRSSLKRHQLTALAMMSERECGLVEKPQFPSIWERSTLLDGTSTYRHKITGRTDSHPYVARGGILADEMGLGKTLSILSLICWSIDSINNDKAKKGNEQSSSTLIVTPKSTIPGWEEQIRRHIFPDQIRVAVYHGSGRQIVGSNFQNNDIILTTYETLRAEFHSQGPLYVEKWFRVVLDEANHIGNRSTMKFRAACGIQARRRWCLTGTPIYNSLDNYGALLSFIRVAPFVDKTQFDLWISNPIRDKRRNIWSKLQLLVRCTSLRRTKQTTDQSLNLSTRKEKIEHIDLHQSERELYEFFRQQTATIAAGFWRQGSNNQPPANQEDKNMLSLINLLRLACNHEDLLPPSAINAWRAKKSDAVDWQLMESSTETCVICQAGLEEALEQSSESTLQCGHSFCAMCALQRDDSDTADMSDLCPRCSAGATMGTDAITPCSAGAHNPSSTKIEALVRNLRLEQAVNRQGIEIPPVKSVVFSYWTKMLDLTQMALHSNGFSFERIDGQMSLRSRSAAIHRFAEDMSCTVLLATIGSAAEGIDLTAASFVHIMEPHWNPMVEAQAIARVHRIGQIRPVIATRYVTRNSIEEYVRWIQEDKLSLISRSLNSDDVWQKDVDDERWKVISTIHKRDQISELNFFLFRNLAILLESVMVQVI
ncbi:Putative helicase, Zinc finger, RING-type, Zinc finger, RING/FYVE/PHD-type [Colletotrichum destructivum]|uniref:Helicase, Zinc finger, RING-type, Zinc finger, RING/FYVE/PHD-type n=1 Tax=Colletotrichum destructivum TaxID=34406 RepID=A0AAX4IXL3_9PEZI|nr:Putative helicase, Zinc finger, RING-type, Zinc finger, RING/FYVE/PHD-type [Colletotrichum destructivum]